MERAGERGGSGNSPTDLVGEYGGLKSRIDLAGDRGGSSDKPRADLAGLLGGPSSYHLYVERAGLRGGSSWSKLRVDLAGLLGGSSSSKSCVERAGLLGGGAVGSRKEYFGLVRFGGGESPIHHAGLFDGRSASPEKGSCTRFLADVDPKFVLLVSGPT